MNIYTWLLMLTMCLHGDGFLSVELRAELIYLVQRRIQPGCLLILEPPGSGIWSTSLSVMLQKILIGIRKLVHLKITDLETYNYTEISCSNGVPPMYIILSSGESVQLVLKKSFNQLAMARTSWLMFFDSATSLPDFFAEINVPFSSLFLVAEAEKTRLTVTEVYRVAPGESLLTYTFGSGSPNVGYNFTSKSLYERRNTLHGLQIKGASLKDPPITELQFGNGRIIAEGFLGNVWKHLERQINFTTRFLNATPDGHISLKNQSWNGMIFLLDKRDLDIALSEFTLTVERMMKIDYTIPLYISKYQIFIRDPKEDYLFFGRFLEPFSLGLMLTVLGCIIMYSVMLALSHTTGRGIGNDESDGPSRYSFNDSILYMFGIFCMQGHEFTPKATSCRIIYISSYFTSLIVLAAYSSVVIVFAATRKTYQLPFTNLEGLLADKSYELGVNRGSAVFNMFQNTTDDTMMKAFITQILPNEKNLPCNDLEGIQRVCSGKYAFVSSYMKVLGMKNICDVIVLPEVYFHATFGMVLVKNSPYKGIIDYNLNLMRAQGIIQRIRSHTWNKKSEQHLDPSTIVDMYYILPILLILTAGTTISFLFLVLEIGWHRYQN